MFANQVGDKAIAKLLPLYDQRVKPKVDQAKLKAQPFVDKAWPKIQPVVPKVRAHLEMIGLLLWKKQQMASKEAHAKIKSSFVDATCPQVEGYLKELKKQKGLYSPAVDESVKKACSEADEFLMFMYKSLLVLLAVIFRRLIIRAVFFILFLPLRIMFLPFTLFFSKRERGIRKEHVHQG